MEQEVYNIVIVGAVGVQFTGTRDEAQEHLNSLAGYVQHTMDQAGIRFVRREQFIKRKEEIVDINTLTDGAAAS